MKNLLNESYTWDWNPYSMNERKPKRKAKKGRIADAPASEGGGARARKEVFTLADGSDIHELMASNSPLVAKWAFQCVQKAARGRASLFEQKVALLMIQKSTPSTGRKGEEAPEDVPEGTTKDELRALNSLILQEQGKHKGDTTQSTQGQGKVGRVEGGYKVREVGQGE